MTKPKLEKKQQFIDVLSSYRVSDQAAQMLTKLDLVLIVGPTSVGKNAIIDQLLATGNYEAIISDTTRPPRMEKGKLEEHGVRYFFRSEDDILADLKAGEFLEAAVIHDQQVSGISIRELKKALDYSKAAINEIEVVGVDHVMNLKSDAHAIFILPPSFEEWMRRMTERGEMASSELKNRMGSMKMELETALSKGYYTLIVNDDLDEAVQAVRGLVENASPHANQQAAEELARTLLARVTKELQLL